MSPLSPHILMVLRATLSPPVPRVLPWETVTVFLVDIYRVTFSSSKETKDELVLVPSQGPRIPLRILSCLSLSLSPCCVLLSPAGVS